MRENISCVFLDLLMPLMDGKETYRELKKIDPDIKVILSTGFGREGEIKELISEGILDVLPKPYTIQQVSDILQLNLISNK